MRPSDPGVLRDDGRLQLYLRDVVRSVTRRVEELRVQRVTLSPGEKRTVTFALGPDALSFVDRRMQRVVEPGRFEVMVGSSSEKVVTAAFDVVTR